MRPRHVRGAGATDMQLRAALSAPSRFFSPPPRPFAVLALPRSLSVFAMHSNRTTEQKPIVVRPFRRRLFGPSSLVVSARYMLINSTAPQTTNPIITRSVASAAASFNTLRITDASFPARASILYSMPAYSAILPQSSLHDLLRLHLARLCIILFPLHPRMRKEPARSRPPHTCQKYLSRDVHRTRSLDIHRPNDHATASAQQNESRFPSLPSALTKSTAE